MVTPAKCSLRALLVLLPGASCWTAGTRCTLHPGCQQKHHPLSASCMGTSPGQHTMGDSHTVGGHPCAACRTIPACSAEMQAHTHAHMHHTPACCHMLARAQGTWIAHVNTDLLDAIAVPTPGLHHTSHPVKCVLLQHTTAAAAAAIGHPPAASVLQGGTLATPCTVA